MPGGLETLRQRLFVLFALLSTGAHAQWLNHPTPGTPRTKDGKPNLSAKTPRLAGKPGVWQVEPERKGEIQRLLGDDLTVGLVPGDPIDTFSKYFYNILADFTPEQAPIRPEALAIMHNRPKDYLSPTQRCLPEGVPRADLISFPFKIVQTPQQLVLMYEIDNTRRQIYTDGRQLPVDPSPAWLGYSAGRWEGATLVVDKEGLMIRVSLTRVAIRKASTCAFKNVSIAPISGTWTCRSPLMIRRCIPSHSHSRSRNCCCRTPIFSKAFALRTKKTALT